MRILPWLRMVGSRQFGLSSPYDCHMYALRGSAGILLIDAGSGLENGRVLSNLQQEFGDLSRGTILITHKHPDHAAGAWSLSRELGWPVVCSCWTKPVFKQSRQAGGFYPDECRFEPCEIGQTFEDGSRLALEGFELQALRVRGHSDDSAVFFFEQDGKRCLLAADVVFYGGVLGVIPSSDSSLSGYKQELPKLATLEIDVLLPAHGLFTLQDGQQHIDMALAQLERGFLPRMIGQGDLIF